MAEKQKQLRHFFLTRFNLLLWKNDKEGNLVRTTKWLDHRFSLFEKYCLPSIKNQTCQDFEWIVLFDSTTPEKYKERVYKYKKECPQFIPIFVEPANGRYFAEIFRKEIVKRITETLKGDEKRVLTTYLDNDDALNVRFVENLKERASTVSDGTFFYYDKGYQYYVDGNYLLRIKYPRNHFVSVIENGNAHTVKGIFGYGRHYYIDKIEGANIVHVDTEPMWCEVVHEKNMINDANFLIGVKMVTEGNVLQRDFGLDVLTRTGKTIYVFRFLPRYLKIFVRRAKHFLVGQKW